MKSQKQQQEINKTRSTQKNGFCLTYKTHLPKQELKVFLQHKIGITDSRLQNAQPNETIWDCIISHEKGHQDTPYEHTHCIFRKFRNLHTERMRFANPRHFDWPLEEADDEGNLVIHPHIRAIFDDPKQWYRTAAYITKEDPECKQQHKFFDEKQQSKAAAVIRVIAQAPTLADAILRVGDIKQTIQIEHIFNALKLQRQEIYEAKNLELLSNMKYTGWQTELNEMIEQNPTGNPRNVLCIIGIKGKEGKSTWAEKWMVEHPNWFWLIKGIYNLNDLVQILTTQAPPDWNTEGLIIDVTRANIVTDLLWGMIETLMGGTLRGGKYQSNHISLQLNWIILLMNEYPLPTASFSDDRPFCIQIYDSTTNDAFGIGGPPITYIPNPYTERKRIEAEHTEKLFFTCLHYVHDPLELVQKQQASLDRLKNKGVKRHLNTQLQQPPPPQRHIEGKFVSEYPSDGYEF